MRYRCIAVFYGEEALIQKELLNEQGFEDYIEGIDLENGEIIEYEPEGTKFGHYILVEDSSVQIYQAE